jgi:hypothetical protein
VEAKTLMPCIAMERSHERVLKFCFDSMMQVVLLTHTSIVPPPGGSEGSSFAIERTVQELSALYQVS